MRFQGETSTRANNKPGEVVRTVLVDLCIVITDEFVILVVVICIPAVEKSMKQKKMKSNGFDHCVVAKECLNSNSYENSGRAAFH